MAKSNDGCGTPKGNSKLRVTIVMPQNSASQLDNAANYSLALSDILRRRDVFRFRNFLAANGRGLPDEMMLDTHKMETLLHQLTLTMPALADLHADSRRWLDHHTLLTSQNPSLNEAARRTPGEREEEPGLPPPVAGKRTIFLKLAVPSARPHQN